VTRNPKLLKCGKDCNSECNLLRAFHHLVIVATMSRQTSSSERTPLLSSSNHRSDGNGEALPPVTQDIVSPPYKVLVPICVAIWTSVLVSSLDSTIVATLVGSISSSFNKSEQSSWLGTSYLLSVCCFTPIYGRLCDVMGRKYAMLLALSFFTLGTLLCGLSNSMGMLIAARAFAGVGGGGLTTCTSTILSDIIPIRNRGLYQGLTNIIYGLGSGMGGPIGGWMNDTWGWRNAFLGE
jgi:Na+/melibiose symporter-like transporter